MPIESEVNKSDTLVVFAHPAFEKSRVHRTWIPMVQSLPFVQVRDLCELYPRGVIDIKAEQAALEPVRTLVLQHPLYWYSCPGILKEWMDQVLEHGWAYGRNGGKLDGKRLVIATSAGGLRTAYQPEGHNLHRLKDYLLIYEGIARLCKMDWLGIFALHGSLNIQSPQEAVPAGQAYVRLLEGLHGNTLDLNGLRSADNLFDLLGNS